MVNQRDTASNDKIKFAEEVVASAYGEEFVQAVRYLLEHNPKDELLARIAKVSDQGFGHNMAIWRVWNACERADEAAKANDEAELEKISEFWLEVTDDVRKAAVAIFRDDPKLSANADNLERIMADLDRRNHIADMQAVVQDNIPSMTDDAIVTNNELIQRIFDENGFRKFVWAETVEKADNITIVDDEGNDLDKNATEELMQVHHKWIWADVCSTHMDDATFAAKSDREKKETIQEEVVTRFWKEMETAAAASAVSDNEDEEVAREKVRNGESVRIKIAAINASIESTKERLADKVNKFIRQGKAKAAKLVSDTLAGLNEYTHKVTGYTPLEFGKTLYSAFTRRRTAANVSVALGTQAWSGFAMAGAVAAGTVTGLTVASVAAALAVKCAYDMVAPTAWTIWEKKHVNWKAAKADNDEEKLSQWSGLNGWRNAVAAIKSNEKERNAYEYQKKVSKKYGWSGAALMAGATAVMGAASYPLLWGISALTRVAGANQVAAHQYKMANDEYKENQNEDTETTKNRARTGLALGVLGGVIVEAGVLTSIASAASTDTILDVNHNTESATNEAPVKLMEPTKPTIPVVEQQETVTPPAEYDASTMTITEREWNTAHSIDGFDTKWMNVHNAEAADKGLFANADGTQMSIEEAVYKSDRIMALAKAYPDGEGGYIAHMYDENHVEVFAKDGAWVYGDGTAVTSKDIAPECWGTEEEVNAFRALYKTVDCGQKAGGITTDAVNNLYQKVLELDGPNTYMDIDECSKVHFVGYAKPAPAPAPIVEEEPPVIEQPVIQEEVVQAPVYGNADDGTVITTNEHYITDTTNKGWMEEDGTSLSGAKVTGRVVVPESKVEGGVDAISVARQQNTY